MRCNKVHKVCGRSTKVHTLCVCVVVCVAVCAEHQGTHLVEEKKIMSYLSES